MGTTLPTLYQLTATGAIQFWQVEHDFDYHCVDLDELEVGYVTTRWGQVGTDSPQETTEEVREGTNVGKKNERGPRAQAEFMARAAWTKRKKAGYVESVEAAQAGEVDGVIEGGVEPMLAHSYADLVYDLRLGKEGRATFEKTSDAKKLGWPVFVQPKLDGIRCLAVLKGGKCTLWTRTRRPILSCPHVAEEVERVFFGCGDIVVDGELYNHELSSDFEKIVSAVRKDEPTEECSRLVQYHVYDLAGEGEYWVREDLINGILSNRPSKVVKVVETHKANDDQQVRDLFEQWQGDGYEGAILRKRDGLYENKRSYGLQKFKAFMDAEFRIVGFTEGKGKLAGKLGTWVCQTEAGATFETAMNGSQEFLREYFLNGASYVDKMLTVRFQGYTGANGVPRVPKGHSIRDYE